jgi:DNA-binding response OmpR family regulator
MMKKILLADDSITIQKVVGIIFSTEEYQLEMTDDGDSAFQKALEDHPDLVIADISMPGKDGFELCRAIKSEPELSGTSVLLLPGAFDHFDEVKAAEVCADGWLTKPFESQALLDKVAQLLDAEPLHMDGIAVAEPEVGADVAAESEPAAVEFTDSSIDESALGLEDVEESGLSDSEVEEESPEDIWDAVSFEEADLSQPEESSLPEETIAETSVAADVFGEETTIDAVATPEDTPDLSVPETEELVAPVVEEEPQSLSVEESLEADTVTDPQVESFEMTDGVSPLADSEVAAGSTDNVDDVDFSTFSEGEDDSQPEVDSFVDESSPFIAEVEDDGSLELTDDQGDVAEETDETLTPVSEPSELTAAEAVDEEPLLELADDDIVEPVSEGVAEVESLPEEPLEETPLELSEEDEVIESEPVPAVESFTASAADDLPEEDEGAIVEEEPEEEILDLSVDDIVEDEEDIEEASQDEGGDEDSIEPLEGDDDVMILEGDDEVSTTEEVVESEELIEPEVVVEPAELVEPETDEEVVEPVTGVEEPEDEEEFYFDEPEDEEGEDEPVVPAEVVPVAAVDVSTVEDEAVPATDQVERQLRELSEDELKEVVAKVAGPMIEKLAGEMLEQIAWEVVPDLAEAMISEEIRKIKEGS